MELVGEHSVAATNFCRVLRQNAKRRSTERTFFAFLFYGFFNQDRSLRRDDDGREILTLCQRQAAIIMIHPSESCIVFEGVRHHVQHCQQEFGFYFSQRFMLQIFLTAGLYFFYRLLAPCTVHSIRSFCYKTNSLFLCRCPFMRQMKLDVLREEVRRKRGSLWI